MTLVERLATYLDILGIPTGKLCPGNLFAEACGAFVAADVLVQGGVSIPGRMWTVGDFRVAAQKYVGLDLVSEVLAEDLHPGVSIETYWTEHAHSLLDKAESHPEWFNKSINEISGNIAEVQHRLAN